MRPAAKARLAAVALAAALIWPLAAQNSEAPRAPRIIDTPATPPTVVPAQPASTGAERSLVVQRRPPNAARLAPLPEQRNDEPEEIIVIGRGWRLPDLGSEWRARQEEAESGDRFIATALPLYDPEEPPLRTDAFTTPERRRHGYIDLFRLRFGRRSRD